MRRERKPSPLRGLLLFLLGALVGANAVYFVMSRERAAAAPPSDGSSPNRVEIPLPIGNGSASTPTPPAQTPPGLPHPPGSLVA